MTTLPTTDLDFDRQARELARVARPRLDFIDRLRGLVMVLMALDHTRDFFSNSHIDPTNLADTTPSLFFTRWVTHFCAPVFIFLAGTGAYLAGSRGKARGELARFLVTRGLWLVLLELTVERVGITFSLDLRGFPLIILWAIGLSMVALAGLIWLPVPAVAAFGVATIALHNTLDRIRAADLGPFGPLWMVLHEPGRLALGGGEDSIGVFVGYPLVPWVGVMACGYAFGSLMRLERARRRPVVLALGLGLIAAFVALRAANAYGDPAPWARQGTALFTLMSFLNCEKYPPSLLYLLMTLGPALVLLAAFDREPGPRAAPAGRVLVTFGRVPLFYYLLQWPLAHLLALVVAWAVGQPWRWLLGHGPFGTPEGYGFGLPVVYLMWAVVVALLYPPCRWFAGLKRRRRDWWLSYF